MLFSEFLPPHHPYRQMVPFFQTERSIPLAIVSLMVIFEQLSSLQLESAQAKLKWWEQELYQIWNIENNSDNLKKITNQYKPQHPISIELHKINKVIHENNENNQHYQYHPYHKDLQQFLNEKIPQFMIQMKQHIIRIRYEEEQVLFEFWHVFYGFFLELLEIIKLSKIKKVQKKQEMYENGNQAQLKIKSEIKKAHYQNFGLLHLLTNTSILVSHQRFDIPITYLHLFNCPASVLLTRQENNVLWQQVATFIEQKINSNLQMIHRTKQIDITKHQINLIKNWSNALKKANFKCLTQQIYPKIKISLW